MRSKPFAWTKVKVPVLGQGTWQMGESRRARAGEVAALRLGLELGMTHIDTAEMYGRGAAEEIVAEALRGHRRERVFVVSKVLPVNASYAGTKRACEQSLRRLQTDHLDLYLLHWPGSEPIAETMRAMEDLVAEGKIRHLGVSNFDVDDLREAMAALGRERIACNQVLYNLISALHKSVRNSDPDAALYWLSRMLEAGEDPLYIARRVVRMAVEDIGLADPQALALCMAARDAVDFIGMPEGNLALAQAVVYLSVAPKSNALYTAYGAVLQDVETTSAQPVPLHLRNAPTRLMKQLNYGKGYEYAHDTEGKVANMQCLPDNLRDRTYYRPTNEGIEKRISERLAEIKRKKQEK